MSELKKTTFISKPILTVEQAREKVDYLKRLILYKGWAGTQLAAMLSLIPVIVRPKQTNEVAFTNGKVIFLCKRWFDLELLSDQRGVLLHEVIHCQLQHPQRYKFSYVSEIWQIACDVIVNYMVEVFNDEAKTLPENSNREDFFTLPPFYYKDEKGEQKLGIIHYKNVIHATDLAKKSITKWTTEDVYEYIISGKSDIPMKNLKLMAASCNDLKEMQGGKEGEPYELTLEEKENLPDDVKDSLNLSPEAAARLWEQKLQRIFQMYGDIKGNLSSVFEHESAVTKTPWYKILRPLATANFYKETTPNYTRPSRTSRALNKNKKIKVVQPSRKPKKRIDEIIITVDSSGSMYWGSTLSIVFNEVSKIQTDTKCNVRLIQADTIVQDETVYEYNSNITLADKYKRGDIKIKGGGGTCFINALKRMEELKARFNIYITDLYGDFPPTCKISSKLLWLGVDTPVDEVPFGKLLKVNQPC